jgi:hypothetical protein
MDQPTPTVASVDLFWLPLGAGDNTHCVRSNGRIFEALTARHEHRDPCDLYHSALRVQVDADVCFVVEMAPVWDLQEPNRGVVAEGPVGLRWLGRSRLFRYEIRRWPGGTIPDVADAVDSPQRVSTSPALAEHLLDLVPSFPTATWGRDEQQTGDMWNSNSLTSWLLVRSGLDLAPVAMPAHGRAPGWSAGLIVASRQACALGKRRGNSLRASR